MNDENENNGAPEQERPVNQELTSPQPEPAKQDQTAAPTAPEVVSQPETSPSQPEEESVTLVVTGDVSATERFPASTPLGDALKKMKVPMTSQLRASTGIITEKKLSVGQVGRDAQGNVAISVTKKVSGG